MHAILPKLAAKRPDEIASRLAPPSIPTSPERGDRLAAAALGVALFAVYAAGACPTIYVGDSGELVTAVYLLGIPHPTGYPLYVLLGKLWCLALPVGSVAFRMSLFSAACTATAAALLFRLCRRLRLGAVPALTAALLFAFAPSVWGEANVQRVYGLNAVFVVLATAAVARWQRRRDGTSLALAFGVCGLGATAHAFMAVYALAVAAVAVLTDPGLLRTPRRLVAGAAAFVLGLVAYAYLPIRSRADPRLDWGDPETLGALVDVVLRRDFWERAWLERPADLAVVAADWLASVAGELTVAGAALAVLGLAAARRHRGLALLAVLVMAGNVVTLALHGSRTDLFVWHRYYVPSYVMAACLAALGAERLLDRLARPLRLLPLAIPAFLLATGWSTFDRSRYRVAEAFSEAVLDGLPPGAHLAATDDNVLFVLMYLHLVEGRRPDVDLILQGVGGARLPPLRFDPETEPLFFTHHPNWALPALDAVPVGLVFRAWRRGVPPPAPVLPAGTLPGEDDPRVPKDYLTRNLIGHFHYMLGVTFEARDWPRARREFRAAAAAAPDNDVLFYNLGLIFARNGLLEDAVAAFARAEAINPRHLASTGRPRPAAKLAEATAEAERVAALRARIVAEDEAFRAGAVDGAARERRLAARLADLGEAVAARGHRLRALEIEARLDGDGPGLLRNPTE